MIGTGFGVSPVGKEYFFGSINPISVYKMIVSVEPLLRPRVGAFRGAAACQRKGCIGIGEIWRIADWC